MNELQVQRTENRDAVTTWLWVNDEDYIEINPIDLIINMLENNPTISIDDVTRRLEEAL